VYKIAEGPVHLQFSAPIFHHLTGASRSLTRFYCKVVVRVASRIGFLQLARNTSVELLA
jgi:hypothetical protein